MHLPPKIYRSISAAKKDENVREVQSSVDQSEVWANIWEMLFHLKKCNIYLLVLDSIQPHIQWNWVKNNLKLKRFPVKKI